MATEYFVFSDIHGCAGELKLLLNKIPLTKDSILVFLGDYVDRGPGSKEVIDIILKLKEDYQVITLRGNHEQLFESFINDSQSDEAGYFIYNGGGATLASYANEFGEYTIPPEHIQFLNDLKTYHETNDYLFVHAGLPDVAIEDLDEEQHEAEMLWIRNPFFKSDFDWGKLIVHGHTPVEEPFISEKRINIDTGCVYNNNLTTLKLPEKKFYSVSRQTVEREIHLRDERSHRRAIRFKASMPVYIHMNDEFLQFETENYSQIGMLIRNIIDPEVQVFQAGDEIQGEIGRETNQTLGFKGKIIRANLKEGEFLYAVEITEIIPV